MTDRLNGGQALQPNAPLVSANGQFSLVLQPDGNLVLNDQDGQPVWATGTNDQDVQTATLQDDGNFVLYTSANAAVWASDTYGNPGAYLIVQDDRNVVLYTADDAPLWASNTA